MASLAELFSKNLDTLTRTQLHELFAELQAAEKLAGAQTDLGRALDLMMGHVAYAMVKEQETKQNGWADVLASNLQTLLTNNDIHATVTTDMPRGIKVVLTGPSKERAIALRLVKQAGCNTRWDAPGFSTKIAPSFHCWRPDPAE